MRRNPQARNFSKREFSSRIESRPPHTARLPNCAWELPLLRLPVRTARVPTALKPSKTSAGGQFLRSKPRPNRKKSPRGRRGTFKVPYQLEQLGDLDCVQGRTLANLVAHDPQVEGVFLR